MFLVYEKNYLSDDDVGAIEEARFALFSKEEDALKEIRIRKEVYIREGNYTFMPKESSEDCVVFAQRLSKDGSNREGEFWICALNLLVNPCEPASDPESYIKNLDDNAIIALCKDINHWKYVEGTLKPDCTLLQIAKTRGWQTREIADIVEKEALERYKDVVSFLIKGNVGTFLK